MGILDWILGSDKAPKQGQATQQQGQSADDQAIARYRYLLKTAPPETIEQAHAEAFARLTPEQRRMVLQQLSASVPEAERAPWPRAGPIRRRWRVWRRAPKCGNPALWSRRSAVWAAAWD